MACCDDSPLAGFLQVCLHQLHLADTFTYGGGSRLHERFSHLLEQVEQLPAAAHPTAPALLAALRALALEAALDELPAPQLKQALEKALYTALRRCTSPARPGAAAPTAFSFTPPAEYAPSISAADHAAWT
ncbi:hypothetical protein ACFQ48_00080 [Hymenobacter caeli]|uniref:Uncharacterized protein n=1 Tax=Hymenobacter caeli TaxID=2735894 RepID=A0ABX2FL03_9BACT|nr:hypothetical protein [Hymenobacter caeli]NRT17214.1 hypothetical protein [Hymenobacter caeli]